MRQNLLPIGFLVVVIGLSSAAIATSKTLWAPCQMNPDHAAELPLPHFQTEKGKT